MLPTPFGPDYAACVFAAAHEPLIVLDGDLRVVQVGDAFSRHFGTAAADAVGRSLHEIAGGGWNVAGLNDLLEMTLRFDPETRHAIVDVALGAGTRTLVVNARRFTDASRSLILLAIEDLTDRPQHDARARRAPRSAGSDAQRRDGAAGSRSGEGARRTILLVEDQDDVRNVASDILRRGGYDVIEAAHPSVALSLVRNDGAQFDLLLTDIVMPEMSGRDLVRTLAPLLPRLKVLYTSGYAEHEIVDHGALDAGVAFVAKPFTPKVLLDAVRAALDGTTVA